MEVFEKIGLKLGFICTNKNEVLEKPVNLIVTLLM